MPRTGGAQTIDNAASGDADAREPGIPIRASSNGVWPADASAGAFAAFLIESRLLVSPDEQAANPSTPTIARTDTRCFPEPIISPII